MDLVRCRPLEWHGEVHRAPAGRCVEPVPNRELYVRNKLPAAHTPHTHVVNFRLHPSRAHMPTRNHLGVLPAVPISGELPDLFGWGEWKRWTSRKACGLGCLLLAFRRFGKPRTVLSRLAPGFQHR